MTNDDDPNIQDKMAQAPISPPPLQEGTDAHAIYDFLYQTCYMTPNGAYQLIVTQG